MHTRAGTWESKNLEQNKIKLIHNWTCSKPIKSFNSLIHHLVLLNDGIILKTLILKSLRCAESTAVKLNISKNDQDDYGILSYR